VLELSDAKKRSASHESVIAGQGARKERALKVGAILRVSLHRSSYALDRWPLVAATALLVISVAVLLGFSLERTGGRLVYALDDPYIHMAMAKNLAQHQVWGVGPSEFTSSSSSLLWTSSIAALFAAFGVREAIPFVINVAVALILVGVLFRRLSSRLHPPYVFMCLVVAIFAAPLPALIFAGQEHILHALVTLVFVDGAATWLAAPRSGIRDRTFLILCGLAVLLPLIRYEGLFLVGIVAALATLVRRWSEALLLLLACVAPVVIYGAISASHGWYWLPNSVLIKASRPDFSSLADIARTFGYNAYSRLMGVPALGFLVYASLAAFMLRFARGARDRLQWMLAIFLMMALAHAQFAQPQAFWFFRYEAYLIVVGWSGFALALGEWLDATRVRETRKSHFVHAALVLALIGLSPLPERALRSLVLVPRATANIYSQQYQMGLFLREFYRGAPVALNDIGAASFLGDIEPFDLVGLANREVARRMLNRWYQYDDIQELTDAADVRIAIVYDAWFRGRIPPTWRRAGTWVIPDNVVNGSDTVTFYAVRRDAFPELRSHLQEFSHKLPESVRSRLF
jgi:hypothetical protein